MGLPETHSERLRFTIADLILLWSIQRVRLPMPDVVRTSGRADKRVPWSPPAYPSSIQTSGSLHYLAIFGS